MIKNKYTDDKDAEGRRRAYAKSWARFNYCLDHEFIKESELMYKYYASPDQWNALDKQCMKDQNRPAITFQEIFKRTNTMVAEIINALVDFQCMPMSADIKNEQAGVMNKVLKFTTDNQMFSHKVSKVYLDGLVTGRGYFDIRLGFAQSAQNLYGQPIISTLEPKDVIIPPHIKSKDPKDWPDVHIMHFLSISEIEDKYGEETAEKARKFLGAKHKTTGYDVLENNATLMAYYYEPGTSHTLKENDILSGLYDPQLKLMCVERQFKLKTIREVYFHSESGEYRTIPENHNRESYLANNPAVAILKLPVEVIRFHVLLPNGELIHDKESPYPFFTVVPFFASFINGKTTSLVSFMKDPQDVLNKSISAQFEIVAKAANPPLLINMDNIDAEATGDAEDVEERLRGTNKRAIFVDTTTDPNALNNTILRLSPEQVPQTVDILGVRAEQALNNSSGANAYQTGQTRPDASAKFTAINAENGSRGNLITVQSLEMALTILANNTITLIQEYMGAGRTLHIMRGVGYNEVETLHVNTINAANEIENDLTIGEYGVTVKIQPDKGSSEAAQLEALEQFNRMLIETGRPPLPVEEFIIRSPIIRDKQALLERIEEASQPSEEQMAAQQNQMEAMELENQERQEKIKLLAAQTETELMKPIIEQEKLKLEAEKINAENIRSAEQTAVRHSEAKTKRVKAIMDAKRDRENDRRANSTRK